MSIKNNIVIACFCLCLNLVCNEGAQEREKEISDPFCTIQVSSLFSSSASCVSPKATKAKSSLQVTHRHGACSPLNSGKARRPDHVEILKLDQARVNSIHSKLSKNLTTNLQSTNLPAIDGRTLGSRNYIVRVGFGTPKHDLSLIFDTGSDLTWTQCEPCVSCYHQEEPIFNPIKSASYNNVSCSSDMCSSLSSGCSASTCTYKMKYGDGSVTTGFLGTEKFTLTSSDIFEGVYFGCGENNTRIFKGVGGLLGLGRGEVSFPSQTATTYNQSFSYCLPSSETYTGHLTFGSTGISTAVKYTPIADGWSTFYVLTLNRITIGGQELSTFSSAGVIIDSGTVISRFPPKAYAELRSIFKAKMSKYPTTSGYSILDTCFNLTGYETVTIPKVVFYFSGDAVVELSTNGILYAVHKSKVCLAFAEDKKETEIGIFGNYQQKTIEVVHDGVGGRVGFGPNGCR